MESVMEYILLIIPLVLLELSLKIFCLVKLFKEGSANLSKGLWLVIILLVNFFGPILFLTVGRRRDVY
jgi:hypothetical protein